MQPADINALNKIKEHAWIIPLPTKWNELIRALHGILRRGLELNKQFQFSTKNSAGTSWANISRQYDYDKDFKDYYNVHKYA